jgi:tetratricopeptide (TPR) repeat protein
MTKTDSPSVVALAEEGKRLFQAHEYLKAAEVFSSAANAYTAENDLLQAAEMKNNQSVALLQGKKAQEALDAVQGTAGIFAGAGDLRRQGMALANQAAALEGLKRPQEVAVLYEQAASLLEKAGEDQLRADVLRSLSALHARKGKGLDALIAMQDGLSGIKAPTIKQRIIKQLIRLRFW